MSFDDKKFDDWDLTLTGHDSDGNDMQLEITALIPGGATVDGRSFRQLSFSSGDSFDNMDKQPMAARRHAGDSGLDDLLRRARLERIQRLQQGVAASGVRQTQRPFPARPAILLRAGRERQFRGRTFYRRPDRAITERESAHARLHHRECSGPAPQADAGRGIWRRRALARPRRQHHGGTALHRRRRNPRVHAAVWNRRGARRSTAWSRTPP